MQFYYNGFTIRQAKPTGGKAGKGRNKTSTIQVFRAGKLDQAGRLHGHVYKQIRFTVADQLSLRKAITKAMQFVDDVTRQERLALQPDHWAAQPEQ